MSELARYNSRIIEPFHLETSDPFVVLGLHFRK